ncbi:RNA polymerase sigma factor [Actinoplanes auranticolor]|uniref:RNA polymerase sigma factor n=1 Tax=Actinoplanes auranticolor TaxID=47988 RepID=A0A919SG92_9ACTN|nr:RNA polymerase sigma factor [Actinoplanes auranticolor]GIM71842.1 hypothetical protein Aau02nite_47990 [Actinoplanes auranticolor]
MTIDLAEAARRGDDDAFALLIGEHLAGMRAVAIAMLGPVGEADDVVQDAVLTALGKMATLRDPAAAGPWLRAIVRNNCRMLRRSPRAVPVADPEPLLAAESGADEILHRAVTRDWVRHALAALPGPTREVTVLRYFTEHSSYTAIAEVCAVPVSTVRSRLRDGRSALRHALREAASAAYADARAADVSARRDAEATVAAGERGDFARHVTDVFQPDAEILMSGRPVGDVRSILGMMEYTHHAGVGKRVRDVVVSGDVMVWETDFLNPRHDPAHCPPGLVWLHDIVEGRTRRLRLAYRRLQPAEM